LFDIARAIPMKVDVEAVDPGEAGMTRGTAGHGLSGRLLAGRWKVGRLLGHGGMSAVYEAIHRNGNRVAIKVLRVDRQHSERTRRRFMREGYLANRVGHEGVVTVLDDDVTDDGSAFLVMELLEGMNLEQYCARRGGQIPEAEALAVADAVLDVLTAAHAKQIIHRDIKPSNLFLTNSGRLKLLDFGIAGFRERSGVFPTTGEGVCMGTPGFMAPEQARGRWKDVDARTDLWSVGALMFRLLTGRIVHEAESSNEYVIAAATTNAPSLATFAPSQSLGMVEMVDRALKSDPAQRFQTALEMQTAVRAEMSRFVDCRLPSPLGAGGIATCDESVGASIENAFLAPPEHRKVGSTLGRAATVLRPFAVYGVLIVLLLLYLDQVRREKVRASAEATAPMSRVVQNPAPVVGTPAPSPVSGIPTTEREPPPTSPPAPPSATAPLRAPAPRIGAQLGGTGSALARRPNAPSQLASSPASSAVRFEDVLNERR
jgi:serine/threonine-protein kinase